MRTTTTATATTSPRSAEWIGVDLDGTLAHLDGFKGLGTIGRPIPRMVERVKWWLDNGEDVRIFTARVAHPPTAFYAASVIREWCARHLGCVLPITCVKDMDMRELWDDRAIGVAKNTGERK
jgi:hypothetical protein